MALSQAKVRPIRWSGNLAAWDWRTQQKGDHWKAANGQWGARALSGHVDYFDSEAFAIAFSKWTWTGKPWEYMAGDFAKNHISKYAAL